MHIQTPFLDEMKSKIFYFDVPINTNSQLSTLVPYSASTLFVFAPRPPNLIVLFL